MTTAAATTQAKRFVAYYRVSTARQGRSGLGLEAQREAVRSYLTFAGGRLMDEVTEVESGKRADRPELARAMAQCRLRNATLVVAKLDRLSRSVEFLAGLLNGGVPFVAADMPEANHLTVHVMAAMAQHEREAIKERTKAALKRAKARGTKLGGNPENLMRRGVAKRGAKASEAVRKAKAATRAADLAEVIADLRKEGARTLRALAAGLDGREILAPRGGAWSATQVARVIRRAGEAQAGA
nr:recombinase family protein [Nitrosomonas nitrosa]